MLKVLKQKILKQQKLQYQKIRFLENMLKKLKKNKNELDQKYQTGAKVI